MRLNTAFRKAYDETVLVNIITSDVSHTRRTRNILQAEVAESNVSSIVNGFQI